MFFEIMNEPEMSDRYRWYGVESKLAAAIREGAPQHTIIAAGGRWSDDDDLVFEEPLRDPNVIYNFHFYEPSQGHNLPHDPFKAIVAPRPIGWISSCDANGCVNLAPYSFFNAVCDQPPMVMFSSSGFKDTVANIEATGEFVCNLVTRSLAEKMNLTSASLPHGISEFEFAGLAAAPCRRMGAGTQQGRDPCHADASRPQSWHVF